MVSDGSVIVDIVVNDSRVVADTNRALQSVSKNIAKHNKTIATDSQKSTERVSGYYKVMGNSMTSVFATAQSTMSDTLNTQEQKRLKMVDWSNKKIIAGHKDANDRMTRQMTMAYQNVEKIVDKQNKKRENSHKKTDNVILDSGKKLGQGLGAIYNKLTNIISNAMSVIMAMVARYLARLAVDTFAVANEYDELVRNMQAIGELSNAERDYFSNYAREKAASGTSIFGADEIVKAATDFYATGYGTEDSILYSDLALQLASAGQGMSTEDASAIIIAFKEQMHLDQEQMIVALDQLVKTANVSAAGVSDLGKAWQRIGGMAYIYGQDTATVNTLLASLSSQVKGEAAGTQIRNMLRWLYQPNSVGQKALESLGVSAYFTEGENKGQARNALDVFADLSAALGLMDEQSIAKWMSDTAQGTMIDSETGEEISGKEVLESILGFKLGDDLSMQAMLGFIDKIFGAREIAGASTIMSGVNTQYDERAQIIDSEGTMGEFSDTKTAGSWGYVEGFKKQLGELKITIGEALVTIFLPIFEILKPMLESLGDLLKTIFPGEDYIAKVKEFGDWVREAWEGIMSFFNEYSYGDQETVSRGLKIILALLIEVGKATIVAIMLIIGGFAMMVNNLATSVYWLIETFGKYVIAVSEIQDKLFEIINSILDVFGLETINYISQTDELKKSFDSLLESIDSIGESALRTSEELDELKQSQKDYSDSGKTNPDGGGYTTQGGGGSGYYGANSGAYADVTYAGTGYNYDVRRGYYDPKTGESVEPEEALRGIRRYHTGGFVEGNGEVGAILNAGEYVATAADQAFLADSLRNKRVYDSILPNVITNATNVIVGELRNIAASNKEVVVNLDGKAVSMGMYEHSKDENRRRGVNVI